MANTQTEGGDGRSRSNRGFAAMDREAQRAIARKGGEAVSQDREHMAAIGRKGGEASGGGNRGRNGRDENGASSQPRDSDGQFTSTRSSGSSYGSRNSSSDYGSRSSTGYNASGDSDYLGGSSMSSPSSSRSSGSNGWSAGSRSDDR